MRILGLAKGIITSLSKIGLKGGNSFVRTGLNLTNTGLLSQVDNIAQNLKISRGQVKSVLSAYQKYLDDTGTASNIDFSRLGIVNFIEKNFADSDRLYAFTCSKDSHRFINGFGFDILKDMVRSNINDISPEAKFLLNDLKYLGLDQRSAEIVHKFEQEGIEYITSSKFKKFNKKMEEFLQKILKAGLDKPRKINNFGHGMGFGSTAACYKDNVIEMNPMNIVSRDGIRCFDKAGNKLDASHDLDTFTHEYFHFLHEKKLKFLDFHSMGSKTLFAHLCDKKNHDLYSDLKHFMLYDDMGFYHLGALEPIDSKIHMKTLSSAINYIKENIGNIYDNDTDRASALKIIEEAYEKCIMVNNLTRDYALKTPLETVAEGGMYKLTGKIKTPVPEFDALLEDLGCPQIKL